MKIFTRRGLAVQLFSGPRRGGPGCQQQVEQDESDGLFDRSVLRDGRDWIGGLVRFVHGGSGLSVACFHVPIWRSAPVPGRRNGRIEDGVQHFRRLPPFGTLNAFDPVTGTTKWSVAFGSMFGLPESLGSINLGGPLATAGGLVFIGASLDPSIRAFATQSGKELWRGVLPHSARSTPMTFLASNGKQYIVIAASGHGIGGMKVGDALVAFAFPD